MTEWSTRTSLLMNEGRSTLSWMPVVDTEEAWSKGCATLPIDDRQRPRAAPLIDTYGHHNMIKKRSRPTARVREPSPEVEEKASTSDTPDDEKNLPCVLFKHHCLPILFNAFGSLEDILELRRLRRARQGIDAAKLNKGDVKKKKKKESEGEGAAPQAYGLSNARREVEDDECATYSGKHHDIL